MKQLLNFSVFFSAMAVTPLAYSAMVVLPSDFTDVEGPAGGEGTALGGFNNTVHTVYNASRVAEAGIQVGDVLSGLAFRIGGGPSANRPAPNFRVDDYVIRLSTSQNSALSLSSIFAENRGADAVTVHSGEVVFNAADYDDSNNGSGEGPNEFGPTIVFDNTFTYNGGDLLLEYTHTGALALDGESSAVTSQADAVNSLSAVHTLFGEGFDATEQGFGTGGNATNFAPVVQFTVVPEPSVGLLSGIALLGLLRRRR